MQKMTHRITEELRRLFFDNHDNCISCGYKFKEGDTIAVGLKNNTIDFRQKREQKAPETVKSSG